VSSSSSSDLAIKRLRNVGNQDNDNDNWSDGHRISWISTGQARVACSVATMTNEPTHSYNDTAVDTALNAQAKLS
jgi:hypothetical protein